MWVLIWVLFTDPIPPVNREPAAMFTYEAHCKQTARKLNTTYNMLHEFRYGEFRCYDVKTLVH